MLALSCSTICSCWTRCFVRHVMQCGAGSERPNSILLTLMRPKTNAVLPLEHDQLTNCKAEHKLKRWQCLHAMLDL